MLRATVPLLLLSGCLAFGSFRTYHTPLTSAEGALAVPALVSTAESMGLPAHGGNGQAQVTLEDGTRLYWVPSGTSFVLQVSLAGDPPEGEREVRFREVKVRADQIWELAMQARQQSSVGAAVVIDPSGGAAQQATGTGRRTGRRTGSGDEGAGEDTGSSSGGRRTGSSGGVAAGTPCRSTIDCGSGQFCRDHASGTKVCMGNGGPGAMCSSSIDCSGTFCRDGYCR